MFSANTSQVSEDRLYVEDVFSTYLYTGNQTARTITNGIDLAGKGGMVWTKCRSAAGAHAVFDTNRGTTGQLNTGSTNAAVSVSDALTAYGSTGYSIGADNTLGNLNNNGFTFASWTFRKAPKFFDVVTWTGNGASGMQTRSHNLGVTPGCIIVKQTSVSGQYWYVYHAGTGDTKALFLNLTNAASSVDPGQVGWAVSPTTFGINATQLAQNANGETYVAYLFAHDATSDGIIQCGSYTGNGNDIGPTVTLGWEPQWLFIKRSTESEDWVIYDNMRGVPTDGIDAQLSANLSNAEQLAQNRVDFTATGFIPRQGYTTTNASGSTYVYIAIRRGPMRTPTSGTSVFAPVLATPTGSDPYITTMTTNFPVDYSISKNPIGGSSAVFDRLRGGTKLLETNNTSSEGTYSGTLFPGATSLDSNTNIILRNWSAGFGNIIGWNFRRAPSFFDVVCYTGTGSALTVNHNLGVVPELMIIKSRSATSQWVVYAQPQGISKYLLLSSSAAVQDDSSGQIWNFGTAPTASVFTVGTAQSGSSTTYVAYLFASCPGVSKVGSYVGNDTTQTIDCGFASGARFVMIKGVSGGGVGDWYVWDTARGIIASNDPHLSLNNTNAEITTDDTIDPTSSGFIVNQNTATYANYTGTTYIYLAVA